MFSTDLNAYKKSIAESRAFAAEAETVIFKLVDELFSLREELRQIKAQPLALEWVTPKQAEQLLNRSDKTVRKLARSGAFAINENPGYQKGQRKMEYYLPGLRKYLFRMNLKPEAIEARVQSLGL